jgi:hypothetical protein
VRAAAAAARPPLPVPTRTAPSACPGAARSPAGPPAAGSLPAFAGEVRVGISYAGLCQAVQPGSTVLLGNGAAKLQVTSITSDTELRARCARCTAGHSRPAGRQEHLQRCVPYVLHRSGRCALTSPPLTLALLSLHPCHLPRVLNTKKLGEQRPVHLPGARLAAPLLAPHDLAGLRFAVDNGVDIVTAPFVRCGEDVQLVRQVLQDLGGGGVQVGRWHSGALQLGLLVRSLQPASAHPGRRGGR